MKYIELWFFSHIQKKLVEDITLRQQQKYKKKKHNMLTTVHIIHSVVLPLSHTFTVFIIRYIFVYIQHNKSSSIGAIQHTFTFIAVWNGYRCACMGDWCACMYCIWVRLSTLIWHIQTFSSRMQAVCCVLCVELRKQRVSSTVRFAC